MYSIEYLNLAKKDFNNIINKLKNKSAAKKFIITFEKEIKNILLFPYSNPEYHLEKKLNNDYRYAKVKNFLIFYTIDEKIKIIIISRIIYKKRDLSYIIK